VEMTAYIEFLLSMQLKGFLNRLLALR